MPIRLIAAVAFLLVSQPHGSISDTEAPWPAAEWPHSEPEAQGMRSSELATMLERIDDDNPGIRSLTVVRHGNVVLDVRISPFARGDRHDIHSCTKSVLCALVGIAIDRAELPDLDTPVLDFFPDTDVARLDERKRAMTLAHLLTMSAGLETEDSYLHNWSGLARMRASRDWAKYVLDLPMVAAPGKRFEYSNGVSQLIAVILQKATGRSLAAYAREHLFEPIGIVDFSWEGTGPDDSWGFSGLSLRPLDMARLGYLYLRRGEWDGVQVVPAEWVEKSTTAHINAGTLAQNYGYQWWVDDDIFMMQGFGGQFVYVLPALDLVVVFAGVLPSRQFFVPWQFLSNYINDAVIADHALPANPGACARLDSMVRVLGRDTAEPLQPAPDVARSISGRTFEFDANRMGLRRVILHFDPGEPEAQLDFVVGGAAASLTIGLDGVFRFSELYGQRWACRGTWVDRETFVLEQEAPGKVLRRRATLNFQGDSLTFEIHDRVANSIDTYNARVVEAPPVAK